MNWYEINNAGSIDSPALLIFPERVKQNIQTAIRMVGDVQRLRPHVKTNKSPDTVKLMQEAGITKFKCATISEAEMLGMTNAKDVLLAYQPTGPKLERFIQLINKYPATDFSCLTDNLATAKEQATAFSKAGVKLTVYIDINTGMNRTGIKPGEAVIELMKYLLEQASIKNVGLHVYDGHINNANFAEREKEINDGYRLVEELLDQVEKEKLPGPTIIVGGSPTFPVHAKRKNVECSPGTFIYWDKSYLETCPGQDFLPAAVLLARVISLPADDLITIDLGHKSVAAENSINRRLFILNDDLLEPISQSEEHLVLKNNGAKIYPVGDILYGLPYHVCPTIALYERALTIVDGNKTGEWMNSARDRRISV